MPLAAVKHLDRSIVDVLGATKTRERIPSIDAGVLAGPSESCDACCDVPPIGREAEVNRTALQVEQSQASAENGSKTNDGETMDKELSDRGSMARKAVLGEAYVDSVTSMMDEFNRPLQELVIEYCWGAIWTRPGLDRRTRSIINLAMLASLNRSHEFKLHVRGAVNNGVTVDEIRETLLQVTVYAGVPAGVEAFRLAREVLAEHGKAS